MAKWQYTKGLHDLGNQCYAWLQPDGSWGYSNSGLIESSGETLLVDTLFDLAHTREMLAGYRAAVPAAQALLGRDFKVSRRRGEFVESPLAPIVMAQ